ncbi:MAG: helix-turn-helix transcriptional regulator [Agathobacter sp.]|nr:helix-turn-helix transcriptional regulator [Agathobacter sp.]
MTISERIFQIMEEKGMSRKEFSESTGIALSSISDWKRKKTNPASEKILIICETLGVTPYELLAGNSKYNARSRDAERYVVMKDSELGYMVEMYQASDEATRKRILGYFEAIAMMNEK